MRAYLSPSGELTLRCLLFLFLVASTGIPLLADPAIVTVSPVDLLKAMPPVPDDWTLQQSYGRMEFSVSEIPTTTILREYQVPPPKVVPTPAAPPPPGILQMTIMDLGSRGTPKDNPPLSTKKEEIFALPLFNGTLQDQFFSGTIGNRLLVRISGEKFKLENFKNILKTLDFTGLVTLEKQLPTTPIKTVKFTETYGTGANIRHQNLQTIVMSSIFVDELNPSTNRTWETSCVQPAP